MLRTTILLLFLCCLCTTGRAQQARQYAFTHFTTANGLASNIVRNVVQDDQGFIWVATINGLQRYDGHTFLTFHTTSRNRTGLSTDNIAFIFLDRKKNLWIVDGNNRVGIFNTRLFTFTEIPVLYRERPQVYTVKYLLETHDGQLLLHERFGDIYRFDPAARHFVLDNKIIPAPRGWKRDKIVWDKTTRQYYSTGDSGLVLYNPVTKLLSYRGHNPLNDPAIRAFEKETLLFNHFVDSRGLLLAQSWEQRAGGPTVHKFDRQRNLYEQHRFTDFMPLGYHEFMGSMEQRNGRLWSFGMPFLAEWTADRSSLTGVPNEFRNEQSIKFDYTYDVFEDHEQNLWVSTDNGLYLFNPDAQIFNSYLLVRPGAQAPVEAPVQAILEATDKKIWVGSWGKGLFCYDQQFNPLPLPLSLKQVTHPWSIWDMTEHVPTGRIWMVLQGGGVIVYDPKTGGSQFLEPDIFEKRTIRQVTEDNDGNLWFGTQHGKIIKWDYKASGGDPRRGYSLVLSTALVHKLHADNSGFMWAGTFGQGLLKIDPKTNRVVKAYTNNGPEGERLFTNGPTDMTQYNDSILIVTAGCINVINQRTGKITYVDRDEGLPSNTAQSVQKDNKGIIWVGMVNGLCRLNLQKMIVTTYDRRDGIPYDNFNIAGVEKLVDGRILFYTGHNFLAFDPNKFVQQTLPARPRLTNFALEGMPLLVDSLQNAGKAVLNYNNTSITIDFSTLGFTRQRKFHYFYMLENQDKDWVHTDNSNQAIYNHLSPGTYRFKVKSENADGVTSEEEQSFLIVVRPPVWKTWWFYGLIVLVVALVLYLLDRERIQRLKSIQRMRTEIAGSLHRDINTTLNNINVLSEIAKIKADKDIERSKDFIDQISDKSRSMIEAMDDMLWSIDPENDSMKKTLLRIRELTEGINSTYNTEIDLIVDHKVQSLELEMRVRHELFFFYKEVMLYLVNRLQCPQIFVHFKQRKSKLLVEVLSECGGVDAYFAESFVTARHRIEELGASVDTVQDKDSVSVVLQVEV
ncbi:MAG TPA: two-component regulator propeller domain-containing protein [Chitinophagaceae bacterium]|nr:two-component regulator propeller domain-containing protein [Chitinophagaceae bacterium]